MSGSFVLLPSVMAAIAMFAAGCFPSTEDEYSSDCPECGRWQAWLVRRLPGDDPSFLVCAVEAWTPPSEVSGFAAIVRPSDGTLVTLPSEAGVALGTNGGGRLPDVNADGQPDFWLSSVAVRETSIDSELRYGLYLSPDHRSGIEIPVPAAWYHNSFDARVVVPFGTEASRFVRLRPVDGENVAELVQPPTLEVVGSQDVITHELGDRFCGIAEDLAMSPTESVVCCWVSSYGFRRSLVLLSGSAFERRVEIRSADPDEDVFAHHIGLAFEGERPVLAMSSRKDAIWTVSLWDALTGDELQRHHLEEGFQLLSMVLLQDPSGRKSFDIAMHGVFGHVTEGRRVFRSLAGSTGEIVFSLDPPLPGSPSAAGDVDGDGRTDFAVLNRECQSLEEYSGHDGRLVRNTDLSMLPWPDRN